MVTELAIRDRFLKCLEEVKATEKAITIASAIGSTPEYLSALPKNQRPAIPSSVIANFCLKYHYSPEFIILGKGKKKTLDEKTTEEEHDRWEAERNKYLDLIGKMLDNMLTSGSDEPPNLLQDLLSKAGKFPKRN